MRNKLLFVKLHQFEQKQEGQDKNDKAIFNAMIHLSDVADDG